MKKEFIFKSVPKILIDSTFVGEGFFSKCYKLNKYDIVYKEYKKFNYANISSVKELIGLEYEGFIFPGNLINLESPFKKKKTIGHLMKFVNGNTLENSESLDIKNFLKMLKEHYQYIGALTEDKICLQDFKAKNIIITENNKIIGIDTDLYYSNKEISAFYNTFAYNKMLNDLLYDEMLLPDLINYKIEGIDINDIYKLAVRYGKINSPEFLEILLYYCECVTGMQVETINDLKVRIRKIENENLVK